MNYGIDIAINNAKEALENAMNKKKGIFQKVWNDFYVYGRIHRVLGENGYIPCIHKERKEYKPVFVNDNKGAEIGFYVTEREVLNYLHVATVQVICTANMEKVHTFDDELTINMLEKWINEINFLVPIGSINYGIEDVFSDFDTESIAYRDLWPFVIFSFDCQMNYAPSICV